MSEQLRLAGAAALPERFTGRWCQLEHHHSFKPAVLAAEEVLCHRGRFWIVLRLEGRSWALCSHTDPAAAADDLWRMTGRPPWRTR